MYNTLDALWSDYLLDDCGKMETREEKDLAQKLVTYSDSLRAALSEEQKALLEKFVDCLSDIHLLFAVKAFKKGIRFATSYLWEALSDK